jgi:predicted  nucleic acid-binding Zn-ribbon protein
MADERISAIQQRISALLEKLKMTKSSNERRKLLIALRNAMDEVDNLESSGR